MQAPYGLVYDNANRITQSSGTDGTQDYSYDSTNQLTSADHTTQADEAYSYDANGNRRNTGYGTGTNNQLLTDGTYTYEYDGEGNRTKRTEIGTGQVTEYKWDYRNRLTGVTFKDAGGTVTKTIEYTYDVNDRRIGKKIDGVTTERYVYDGSNIDLVFDGAGVQTHRYLYGIGVDQVLADERGGTVVWALSDNQGTVRDIVAGNGTILNHVVYDSFGKVVSQSDASVEFRFGYTGREQDSETGLDYYRARYYDASNGRFISEDPLGFGAGDGNLTRYVGNSPTNFVDPSGYKGVPPIAPPVTTPVTLPRPITPIPIPRLIPIILVPEIFRRILDAGGTSDGTLPERLKDKPIRPNSPKPTTSTSPQPDVTIPPKPNSCRDDERTCSNYSGPNINGTGQVKYSLYPHISEATKPEAAFDGFKYKSENDTDINDLEGLQETISAMKGLRTNHRRVLDDSSLVAERYFDSDAGKYKVEQHGIVSTNVLFKDPYKEARHVNVYIRGSHQSAGSAGKYVFCQEGNPPKLVVRFGIFNIKDNNGNPYYKRSK